MKTLRDALNAVAWPADVRDRVAHVSNVSRSGRAGVYEVELTGGQRWCLKRHATVGRQRQELDAMQHARAEGLWGVLRVTPSEQGLLMPWVDGQSGQTSDEGVVRQAASWLRELHALKPLCDGDPLSLKRAFGQRWGRLTGALASRNHTGAHQQVLRAANEAWQAAWKGADASRIRVLTHGDFAPYNWIVRDGALQAVIDFEYARDDALERDLARYWLQACGAGGAAWRVFIDAYGLSGVSPSWLQLAMLIEAGGTYEVGLNTNDAALIRAGLNGLKQASKGEHHGGLPACMWANKI